MRSEHSISEIGLFSNPQLVISFFICAFLQVAVISFPTLAELFQVVPLTLRQWAIVLLLSIAPIVIVELQKKVNQRFVSK
jgi:Ca2+-transporting ATPase